jgi:ubiquinone/menaquinone biosynthesis C-methylase UbiE
MLELQDEDRHWWFATRTRAILAYLDRHMGPGEGRRVLDVGCGAANMAHHLEHYGHVIGADNNPRPLTIARQRGMEVYQGSADALPFGDDSFDLVAMLDVVEHIPAHDRVVAECRRVLRRPAPGPGGGKLLVTVPAFMFLWSRNDEINMHQRRYTIPELTRLLEGNGFRVLRISYNNFFIFPLAASLIMLRRGRREPELASPHFDDEAYQVEMEPAAPAMNATLSGVGKLEASLLRRTNLPFGTSIIAIAEKIG